MGSRVTANAWKPKKMKVETVQERVFEMGRSGEVEWMEDQTYRHVFIVCRRP